MSGSNTGRNWVPSISIVLATYNGEKWIRAQLESVLAQTITPREIIVSDDVSEDGTLAIVEELQRTTAIPIRIVRKETRGGWRENFMGAVALATGEFVAFCDQDDVWRSDKLERVIATIDDRTTLVYHGAAMVDAHGTRLGHLARGPRRSKSFAPLAAPYWRTPLGFSMVFARRLAQHHDLWNDSIDQTDLDQRAAHDQWFWFLGSVFGNTSFIADELVSYRLHGRNAMGHSQSGPSARDLVKIATATADKCRRKILILENRIALLRRMADLDTDDRNRVDRAVDAMERAVQFNRCRIQMLDSEGRRDRFGRMGRLLVSHGYTRRFLPEGQEERVRDVLAFVARWIK